MTHDSMVQHNYGGDYAGRSITRRVSRTDGLVGRLDDMYSGQGAVALGLHGMHEVLETCQTMRDLARAEGSLRLTTSTAFMRDLTLDVVEMEEVDGSLDDTTNSTLTSRSNAADFAAVGNAVMKMKTWDGRVRLTKAKLDRRCFRGRRLSAVCCVGLASSQGRANSKRKK